MTLPRKPLWTVRLETVFYDGSRASGTYIGEGWSRESAEHDAMLDRWECDDAELIQRVVSMPGTVLRRECERVGA